MLKYGGGKSQIRPAVCHIREFIAYLHQKIVSK